MPVVHPMFGIYTQFGHSSKYSYNKNCTSPYYINLISIRANFAFCGLSSLVTWLQLALWLLRIFLKLVNLSSLFCNNLPLEKGMALHLYKTQECFVPSLVEIGLVVLEKKIKYEKFTDRWTTDNRRSEKLT